jgi:vacuolar protein sorting-associated protein 13A/C
VGEVFESALKKLKEEKKEDGMMSRLGKKVVDNLQLRIKNVHVRFEEGTSTSNNSYAWGLTLDEISLTTTDATWKPSFIERTN